MKQDEYFDEQIIDMRNQSQRRMECAESGDRDVAGGERSIDTGIRILGKWICFERRFLAEDTVSMMLPTNFVPMDPEIAKRKYPSEQRPETILTDDTGTVNLLMQYMDGEESDETIERFRNQIFGMMKRVNPGIREQEIGSMDAAGKKVAYVEFSNPTLDGKLYNLMFYLTVNGRPLMGSFNCQTKEMKYWRKAAIEMVQSVEVAKEAEKNAKIKE